MLAYGLSHSAVVMRDVRRWWRLRGRRVVNLAEAGEGRVLLRGRARSQRLLSPPSGGERLVAWRARGSFGYGSDAEHVAFELCDDGVCARVEPEVLELFVRERTDGRGFRLRAVEPDAEVVVCGFLERGADGGLRVKDVPGAGIMVVAGAGSPIAPNVWRAMLGLGAFGVWAVTAAIAHLR